MTNNNQVDELIFLDDIQYYKEHTWVKVEGNIVRVGITDFAINQFGNIMFIELPQVGDFFNQGEVFGVSELGAKTALALYMPLSGEIESVNNEVVDTPENVYTDPYGIGWMLTIKPRDLSELSNLLLKDEYITLLKKS